MLFLLVSETAYSQEIEKDSTKVIVDTLFESSPKKGMGSALGKLLGYDREKEIVELKRKIKSQRTLIDSMESALMIKPKIIMKPVPVVNTTAIKSIKKDERFISDLPKAYGTLPKTQIVKITKQIDLKIEQLIQQRDSILKAGGNLDLADAKNTAIQSLRREKNVIRLSQESNSLKSENSELTYENVDLKISENKLKKYLYSLSAALLLLVLAIAVILQRKRIQVQDIEIDTQLRDINKKNSYLEHAAKLIRHDMHSGINTYIPRGITSLEKRLDEAKSKELKVESSIKMIKEGLNHAQRVYKNVYAFTNLVKQDAVLERTQVDLKKILEEYVSTTAYADQVQINDLVEFEVNSALFCMAVDNLIRNGLKYNDSLKKKVNVYMEEGAMIVEDNGRGLDLEKFEKIKNNKNKEGLGLNIAIAVMEEHRFEMKCEKINTGTKIKILLNK